MVQLDEHIGETFIHKVTPYVSVEWWFPKLLQLSDFNRNVFIIELTHVSNGLRGNETIVRLRIHEDDYCLPKPPP